MLNSSGLKGRTETISVSMLTVYVATCDIAPSMCDIIDAVLDVLATACTMKGTIQDVKFDVLNFEQWSRH